MDSIDVVLMRLKTLGAHQMEVSGDTEIYGEEDGSEPAITCVIGGAAFEVSAIVYDEQQSWKVLQFESGKYACNERSRKIQVLVNDG